MKISEKFDTATESSWLVDSLTQDECATARYIAQVAVIIQRQRKAKGYTQKELAQSLGVSQAMVSRWENGEENITLATLVKIATALEIELYNPLEKQAVTVLG